MNFLPREPLVRKLWAPGDLWNMLPWVGAVGGLAHRCPQNSEIFSRTLRNWKELLATLLSMP